MTASTPDQHPKVDSVLVIDDDDNWCFISKKLLSKAKACNTILTAKNGLVAIQLLQELEEKGEKMPDIILLDIKMPVMDGFGFLETLKSSSDLDLNQTKIYICSSSLHPKDRKLAEHYAVDGFITKPLTVETIKNILKNRSATDQI